MKKNLSVLIVAALLATTTFADPLPTDERGGAGVIVKSGIVEDPSGATWDVGPGLYINDFAWGEVKAGFNALKAQNSELTKSLQAANVKILDCSAYIPGLPAWAYVAISFGLSALTVVAGYFSIKEVTTSGN